VADPKPKKNRFHIALTLESRSEFNKKIPVFEITAKESAEAKALLKDICAGNVSQLLKINIKPKPPPKGVKPVGPTANTKVLAKMFAEANEKDRALSGLVEIAKQELVRSKLISKKLADEGNIKLGNETISIRHFLYLVRDALGNRTTSGEAASVGRAINQRGGVFFEFFIPLFSEVQQAEKNTAIENLKYYLASAGREKELDIALKNLEAHYSGAKSFTPPANINPKELSLEQNLDIVNQAFNLFGRITPDIYIFRDTELRASSKEVSDYFSGLMIKTGKKSVTIIPNAIGESKFESVTPDLIPQMIESVARISKLPIGSEFLTGVSEVKVSWGKTVLTILQSEVDPPAAKFKQYEEKIRKASGSKQLKNLTTLKLTKTEEATTARKIIKLFVELAKEFKTQEEQIEKLKTKK